MSKKSKIRWRESDLAELQRVIKNFNAKLTRLDNKGANMDIMPDRLSKKDVMGKIETRADFNRFVKSAQGFTQRGAEATVKTKRGAVDTKWAFEQAQKAYRREQARKKRELAKLKEQEVTSRGKGTGVTRAEMGSVKENELKPSKKNVQNMSQREWDKFKQRMEKAMFDKDSEAKRQKMKENYIKAMINVGVDDTILAIVEAMPLDDFVNTVINDEEGSFEFVYSPEELSALNMYLRETWEAAADKAGIDIDDLYADYLNNADD